MCSFLDLIVCVSDRKTESMMVREIPHFIGGKRVAGQGGRASFVFNPATGEQSGLVAIAGVAQVNQAVTAANQAPSTWPPSTPFRTPRILHRFFPFFNIP